MRVFLLLPLSAALLVGCSSTQESPIYEQSSTYRGDLDARHQYANALPTQSAATVATYPVVAAYESVPAQALPVQTQTLPIETYAPAATVMATAPTDAVYGNGEVSGTPGFMAMQQSMQTETVQLGTGAPQALPAQTFETAAQPWPNAQVVTSASIGAAGTPIDYDYRRNLVSVDAATTGQRMPETSRILNGAGQAYTVKQGDTVYSLSRKTCVGVNVIQSMNGLDTNYAIKIGQSISLPASVC